MSTAERPVPSPVPSPVLSVTVQAHLSAQSYQLVDSGPLETASNAPRPGSKCRTCRGTLNSCSTLTFLEITTGRVQRGGAETAKLFPNGRVHSKG